MAKRRIQMSDSSFLDEAQQLPQLLKLKGLSLLGKLDLDHIIDNNSPDLSGTSIRQPSIRNQPMPQLQQPQESSGSINAFKSLANMMGNQAGSSEQLDDQPLPTPSMQDAVMSQGRMMDQDQRGIDMLGKPQSEPIPSNINQNEMSPEQSEILKTSLKPLVRDVNEQVEKSKGLLELNDLNKKLEARPGAVEELQANSPLRQQLEMMTGMKVSEDQLSVAKNLQDQLAGVREKRSELIGDIEKKKQADDILSRMENGTMTTSDKVILGLALAAPFLIGGLVAGKEGALMAGGGGIKGLGEGLTQMEEFKQQDKKEMRNLLKEQEEGIIKESDLSEKLAKVSPSSPLAKYFGDKLAVYKKGDEVRPALILNDFTALDLNKKITEPQAKQMFEKEVPAFKEMVDSAKNVMQVVDQMEDILNQVEKGYIFPQTRAALSSLPIVGGYSVKTKGGQEGEAKQLYEALQGIAKTNYMEEKGWRALTEGVQGHLGTVIPNPFDKYNLSSTSIKDAKTQLTVFKDVITGLVSNKANTYGFVPDYAAEYIKNIGTTNSQNEYQQALQTAQDLKKDPKKLSQAKSGQFVQ